MAEFFAELKRRQMFRVAAAYAVVAWLAVQVVNNLAPALKLPEWASSFVVVLLSIGLPVALIFAWVQQMPSQGAPPARNAVLDWTLVGALAAVLLFHGLSAARATARCGADAATRSGGILTPARAFPSPCCRSRICRAMRAGVLLRRHDRRDHRGARRECRTCASSPAPRRSSSRGRTSDLRAIGQALSATHLIEGSVRKAGDRVRITAQLIRADNGSHLWTENYDRELTDISPSRKTSRRRSPAALRVPLGLPQGENLVSNRGIDPESIEQYLRAKALYRARGLANLNKAVALMDRSSHAIRIMRPLGRCCRQRTPYCRTFVTLPTLPPAQLFDVSEGNSREKAEPAAQKAIQLDPSLADGYVALGTVQSRAGKISAGRRAVCKGARAGRQPAGSLEHVQPDAFVPGGGGQIARVETTIAGAGTV